MILLLVLIFMPIHAQLHLSKEVLNDSFKKLEFQMPVRVLLDEKLIEKVNWKLKTAGGFVVFVPEKKTTTVFKSNEMHITSNKNTLILNGKPQGTDHLFIFPLKGFIGFGTHTFDGVFALTKLGTQVFLVNHVDLEDYVLSVLPYESVLDWPDEVQKASCIAMRSYGIAKVLEQRGLYERNRQNIPYDIKNTNSHQIYKGRMKDSPFKKIIDETRGIVLAYNNKPIVAMFDICCGGTIPAQSSGIHFSKAPYLARKYPCHFCKNYKFYWWYYTYSLTDLEKELRKEFPQIGAISEIRVSKKDTALKVSEIKFRSGHHWHTISGKKFKSLFKNLRSLNFTIERSGRTVTIEGRGHGHLMGLCQRGAFGMAQQGYTYKNILKYYYPGTQFMKLKKEQ